LAPTGGIIFLVRSRFFAIDNIDAPQSQAGGEVRIFSEDMAEAEKAGFLFRRGKKPDFYEDA